MIKSDRRNATRVALESKAEIRQNGVAITGEVRDISLSGLYVNTPARYDTGTSVEVILHFGGTNQELHIPLKGLIVRRDDRGMAIRFQQLEIDGVVNLRNIIIYAHQGVGRFFKEK